MGRSGYGSVGGRRSRSAAWQWMIIGMTLGFACSAIMVLSLLTLGILNIDTDTSDDGSNVIQVTESVMLPTDIPQATDDVQATIDAAVAATQAAQPTNTTAPVVLVEPPTATSIPTESLTVPTSTPQPDVNLGGQGATTDTSGSQTDTSVTVQESIIPVPLQGIISEMALIDGGTFEMGTNVSEVAIAARECIEIDQGTCQAQWGEDSSPVHSVTIDTFQMETTEVTLQQYVTFLNWMGPNSHVDGCSGQQCVETTATLDISYITFNGANYDVSPTFVNFPVSAVTWYGARAYCEAIGRRLPTEVEWERAARGPSNFIYPWGNERNLDYARTSRPVIGAGATDIGSFVAGQSVYGLFDMAGNVAEWTNDYYQATYYSQPSASGLNPTGPASGTDRAIRGGSWDTPPFFARSIHRQHLRPDEAELWLGFRCAADYDPNAAAPVIEPTIVVPDALGPTPNPETTAETVPPVGNQ